ncbi:MAG: hypothetical protein KKE30_07080 [Gammaproteobacteria bacterium]|nr:hypothetical protein [Gammaproteobacteria bacterium]MBU1556237.1 hypothetical protein [Gammaproteobacteria bacterium]MBU2071557.1 hypothetical protein [Gammaproteobacteria bacterium]MBU2184047.1 hypothetical protein [Gammaproteobacteria bacterium]MBU2206867.1 hypothetical protein [Gammaproteobacteria bacterium]
MDLFLVAIVLFLLTNIAVAVTMLRRVNLHNDSVLAWEQQQTTALRNSPVVALPTAPFDTVRLPEAA